ncbi:hypothetical protein Syun_001295 [Stephania yunnanensis]|uniref:Uncharacterized protein n=1 Tax=Stephania yunnanensis TaxID=152371 RepID=A0AAP0LGD6_9MAGN
MAEEAEVQIELVLPIYETLYEEMLSAPTDTGVRVTAKARQSREFQRHHPEKFHSGTECGTTKIHDVLTTPNHMRSNILPVSLFGEVDVWLRTTVASMWTLKIGSWVFEEPNSSRRSAALQSKMGVWPWVSMAPDEYGLRSSVITHYRIA